MACVWAALWFVWGWRPPLHVVGSGQVQPDRPRDHFKRGGGKWCQTAGGKATTPLVYFTTSGPQQVKLAEGPLPGEGWGKWRQTGWCSKAGKGGGNQRHGRGGIGRSRKMIIEVGRNAGGAAARRGRAVGGVGLHPGVPRSGFCLEGGWCSGSLRSKNPPPPGKKSGGGCWT